MVVPSSDLVIGKIIQLIANIRQGTRANEVTKKLKKKTEKTVAAPAPAPVKPVIDMDDE